MVEYEYNLRCKGEIFYDTWTTLKEMCDLWNVKEEDADKLKERLHVLFTVSTLVRRLKTHIEEV